MSSRTIKLGLAILAISTTVWAFSATAASAHSGLESSKPVDGSVVTEAPTSISFTFDEELLADADSISLNAADGTNVASAKVQPTGKTVELPWPANLPAGDYQAAYRVVSADGHPVTGAISFAYAPAGITASAAASVQPSASAIAISDTTEPESTGGNPWLGLGIGVLIGLVLVVLFAAMRRKRA